MDNLDRTNVVQATIAKYILNKQLIEAGVLNEGAGVDDFENLSKEFRESTWFCLHSLCNAEVAQSQCGRTMPMPFLPHMVAPAPSNLTSHARIRGLKRVSLRMASSQSLGTLRIPSSMERSKMRSTLSLVPGYPGRILPAPCSWSPTLVHSSFDL